MLYQEADGLSYPAGDEVGGEAQEDLAACRSAECGVPLLRIAVLRDGFVAQPPFQLRKREPSKHAIRRQVQIRPSVEDWCSLGGANG